MQSNLFGHSSLNPSAEVVLSCCVPAGAVLSHAHGPGLSPHLVLDALHGGPAERGDVHSHGLPVLTQHTQLELYCLPLLQTVTFVCHANNSKGIDLSFHLTYGGKYETELRGLCHLIPDFQYYKCCFYSQFSSVNTVCSVNKIFNSSIYCALVKKNLN